MSIGNEAEPAPPTDTAGTPAPGDADAGCGLPEVEVSDRHRQVQAAAFAMLLDDGQPVTAAQIAARSGIDVSEVIELLADFDAVGRVRFDDEARIVGIAGLSIEPTRHRLDLGDATRWTWCALDAIGILGALGRAGMFTTQIPDSDRELTVTFTADGAAPTDAVVFIADGYGSDSVVETWCPTVNLFADTADANMWARAHGVTGRPVPVGELVGEAAAMWAPVTAAV